MSMDTPDYTPNYTPDYTTYYTIEGDHVDALARRFLGSEARVLDLVKLNPHVLPYGPVLPANVRVDVPQAAATPAPVVAPSQDIRLW
jgi:phage tail protein X